jgi:proteasome accessory factor A
LELWRGFWILLYPALFAYVGLMLVVALVLLSLLVLLNALLAGALYFLIWLRLRDEARCRAWRIRLFGAYWITNDDEDSPFPVWIEAVLTVFVVVALAPGYVLLAALLALMELRRTQERLLAFLASRAVLGGSGWLDAQGRFHLTEKASTRRTIWTEYLPDWSRPVFPSGHFFKMMAVFPPRWRDLLRGRQRLQISLGDSNLCEEAEYLRVATTLLVLDAIEAGALRHAPILCRPLSALHQLSRDPTLTRRVAVRSGHRLTALEIQRFYLEACRRFVAQSADPPPEAMDVLRRWADVLDQLTTDRSALVGRLDWVTKQFFLERAGAGLPWAARKKIDLRYHELSPSGYWTRLQAMGLSAALTTAAEVDQAMRCPPPSSPALQRAHYIREFSGSNTLLKVGWRFLEIIKDGATETIELRDPF